MLIPNIILCSFDLWMLFNEIMKMNSIENNLIIIIKKD